MPFVVAVVVVLLEELGHANSPVCVCV
jgi:hypothetical protein